MLDTFEALWQGGFVEWRRCCLPMAQMTDTSSVSDVACLISSFEGVWQTFKIPDPAPFRFWDESRFDRPQAWLATMIIRGCSDIDRLMDTIRLSGYLGDVDKKGYAMSLEACDKREFVSKPRENVPARADEPQVSGFWLPNGLSAAYFTIPDDELLLEAQQEAYYDQKPARRADYSLGGEWGAPLADFKLPGQNT